MKVNDIREALWRLCNLSSDLSVHQGQWTTPNHEDKTAHYDRWHARLNLVNEIQAFVVDLATERDGLAREVAELEDERDEAGALITFWHGLFDQDGRGRLLEQIAALEDELDEARAECTDLFRRRENVWKIHDRRVEAWRHRGEMCKMLCEYIQSLEAGQ